MFCFKEVIISNALQVRFQFLFMVFNRMWKYLSNAKAKPKLFESVLMAKVIHDLLRGSPISIQRVTLFLMCSARDTADR